MTTVTDRQYLLRTGFLKRLKHPTWMFACAKGSLASYLKWNAQGRPRDVPVVMRAGLLLQEGERLYMTDWHFDCRRMTSAVEAGDLWDRLSAQHPVVRI